MRKIIFTFLLPLLFMATGCSPEEQNATRIILDTEIVSIDGLGGNVQIGYRIEKPVGGNRPEVLSGENWIQVADVTDKVISVDVKPNSTEQVREGILEIAYNGKKTYLTVKQGDEMLVGGDFDIKVKSINDYEIKYSITPITTENPYLYGLIERETYDRFSSDDYFWDYIIEKTPDFAEKLCTGNVTDGSFTHLQPNSRYILYCAAVDENGNNLAEPSILRFTTKDPISFELKAESDGPMATLHVVPSYGDRLFLLQAFPVYECRDKENAYKYITEYIKKSCDYGSYYMGISREAYMKNILSCGESSKKLELEENTDYFAIAIAYDLDCNPTSDMTIVEFSTKAVKPRDLQLSIEIDNITTLSATWKVTASTDDQYLFFVEAEDVIDREWSANYDELMKIIANLFPTNIYGRIGNQEGSVTYLQPNTRYMAFGFGCEAATPTTELFVVYFTTPKAFVGDVEFELIFDKYYNGTELAELYPYDFNGASGKAVLPVRPYMENGSGYYYGIYDGDYMDTAEWPDELVIDNLIQSGISEGHANYVIPYNRTKTALGVAFDARMNYGKVFRKLIYCTEEDALPGNAFGPASVNLSYVKKMKVESCRQMQRHNK